MSAKGIKLVFGAYIGLIAITGVALMKGARETHAAAQNPFPPINWSYPESKDTLSDLEKAAKKNEDIWKHRPSLSGPVDPPPTKIIVGSVVYRVRYTSTTALHAKHALSLSDAKERVIYLDPSRVGDLRDDVFHEVMHVAGTISTHYQFQNGDYWEGGEETAVSRICPGLIVVIRDNPDLVGWLVRK